MGDVLDRTLGRVPAANGSSPVKEFAEVAFAEVLTRYDVVDIGDDYMVVSERVEGKDASQKLAEDGVLDLRELGSVGSTRYGGINNGEYVSDLVGHSGIRMYDKMKRSSASVRKSLRTVKTPVLSATWYVDPYSPAPQDVKAAKFTHRALTQYMSISWPQLLWETLLMLDYGYYMFEKVFDIREIDGEPRVVWKKFAPRHVLDVVEWHYDPNGGPASVDLYNSPGAPDHRNLPINKLAVFSFDK
jgi:hypothetical protein